MKKLVAVFSICLLFVSTIALAQDKAADTTAPFRKYPKLPAFNLLAMDSVTVFNTFNIPEGKPVILMFFSPDCEHCQMVTDTIAHHLGELKDAQIYLLSMMSIAETKKFSEKLGLSKYKSIHLYKDNDFFFPRFYKAAYVPYIVVYDRNKKLVAAYEGGTKITELVRVVNSK